MKMKKKPFKFVSGVSIMRADEDMPYAPEDLYWVDDKVKGVNTRVYIFDGRDGVILGNEPIDEDLFRKALRMAKLTSETVGTAEIIFERKGTERNKKKTFRAIIARYDNGELSLYCRPPWRNLTF